MLDQKTIQKAHFERIKFQDFSRRYVRKLYIAQAKHQIYAHYPKYGAPVQFLIGSGMPDAGFLQKKAFISHPVSRIPCTAKLELV